MASVRLAIVLSCAALAGRARADEIPPFDEPARPAPPVVVAPAPVVEAPPTRAVSLAFAFPPDSTVATSRRDTAGQGITIDLTGLVRVRPNLEVGGSLAYIAWRNWETSYRHGMDYAIAALATARWASERRGFRPYLRVAGGVGVSVMSTQFTIYDLPGFGHDQGTTVIDGGRVAPAYLGEVAVGFRRTLDGRVGVLAETALRAATMRHAVSFVDLDGPTTDADHVDLREVVLRFGLEVGF